MRRLGLVLLVLLPLTARAQQKETFDYWQFDKALIWRGVQTLMMCNGLFTSNRTLDQIFAQELAYVRGRPGTIDSDDFLIDTERRAVAVGFGDDLPAMRAAYRTGLGCIMMPPDQTFDHIPDLPTLETPPLEGDPTVIPWPDGDLLPELPWPTEVEKEALEAAAEWAFDRETHGTTEQVTLSLIVVYKGRIILERYAPGVDYLTKTRTWSTAKSIAVTLMGMLVDEERLSLDEPLDIDWLPRAGSPETDPRSMITLRHVLNMSSGLYPVDNGLEYATGSGLAYWAGASSARGARNRALIREPGTNWDYENYDTLLGLYALKRALGDDQAYLEFPRTALFDKIGMRNTIPGVDRFGDFVMSSQVYTNARDLARFGLLYLNGGVWQGKRLLSEAWIDFVRTPAPSTRNRGNFYGGQWWLVPNDRTDVPPDAYATAGNRGQYVIVVPSHQLVIVRRGLDFGRQGFNRWDLTREVLKAFSTN
ncbi:MAG: serine hydrolase domain-containing protein [Rhodothermales bacterium]